MVLLEVVRFNIMVGTELAEVVRPEGETREELMRFVEKQAQDDRRDLLRFQWAYYGNRQVYFGINRYGDFEPLYNVML